MENMLEIDVKKLVKEDFVNEVNCQLNKPLDSNKSCEKSSLSSIKAIPYELRFPLIAVMGFSQIIASSPVELTLREIKEFARQINTAGGNLRNTMQKYFNNTELDNVMEEKKKYKVVKQNELPNVENHIRQYAVEIAWRYSRSVDLKFELEAGAVRISANCLRLIIEEVVINAVGLSPAGSTVHISSRNENGYYCITVSDNNVSIIPRKINDIRLLKRFEDDKNLKECSGSGLTTVRKIAEMHNGSLKIESKEGEYSGFKISLPSALS